VVLAHGHRRDRQATIVGAAACRDSLLVLGDPAAWSRRDQAILVLVAAISVPDTIGSDTYYMGMDWAVILAAFALARLVPPAWQQPPG
jgi:hypothetical protein